MILNIWGGPGTGKSTIAAQLFGELNRDGLHCELVTEFAKELNWESRTETLKNQLYVDSKQYRNFARVDGKVDLIITDSPILKGPFYAEYYNAVPDPDLYFRLFRQFEETLSPSVNILLSRATQYKVVGRNESEEAARLLDMAMEKWMHRRNIRYTKINAVHSAKEQIIKVLEENI